MRDLALPRVARISSVIGTAPDGTGFTAHVKLCHRQQTCSFRQRPGRLHCAAPGAPTPPSLQTTEDTMSSDLSHVPASLPRPLKAASKPSYAWLEHWYPVAAEVDLPRDEPHQVQVFGRSLVLWYDGQHWNCVEDRCPHRLAPLSEGRIESDGTLQCSYHGFRFNGQGACTAIPQATEPHKAVARCRVTSYSTATAGGLLWVWADPSVPANPSAPQLPEPFQDRQLHLIGGWLVRDLPYDAVTLCENILDPGHALFAHHGLLGDRASAIPFQMSIQTRLSLHGGFQLSLGTSSSRTNVSERDLSFHPPTYVQQRIVIKQQPEMWTAGFALPLRPGWCRVFSTSLIRDAGSAGIPLHTLINAIPTPLLHAYTNEVLDGDLTLLHGQERNMEAAGRSPLSACYLPTETDKGVILYRSWLHTLAGGPESIPWAPGVSSNLPPMETRQEMLLDRYNQHVRLCSSCRKVHDTLKVLQSQGLTGAALCALLASQATTLGPTLSSTVLALGSLSLAATAAAGVLLPHLQFKEYRHARR